MPRALQRALRAGVLDLVTSRPGRRFPPVLHVGVPGGWSASFDDLAAADDPGLRTDVVSALVDRALPHTPGPLVWLTRSGPLATCDADQLWLAAARAAYDECGLSLTLVVMTPKGWFDPRSGTTRRWVRLRPRS